MLPDASDSGEQPVAAEPLPSDGQPVLTAQAAILIDAETGLTLWEHNSTERHFPASTTKMMTALLCAEKLDPNQMVIISERAAKTGESSMNLETGEKLRVHDLLLGLLLNSANDGAVAIAEAVAGDYDSFIAMMNRRAEQMGMTGTHFKNPHGLHSEKHYSTARDLAVLGRAVMAVPLLARITATREAVVPWPGKPWDRTLKNSNRLLGRWDAADGVKTGYTRQAGRCLVASATEDGWRLIAVCLSCKDSWTDAQTLLEWGYANHRRTSIVSPGPVPYVCPVEKGRHDSVSVVADGQLILPVRLDEAPPIPDPQFEAIEAPVSQGQVVGRLYVRHMGAEYEVPLVADEEVRKSLWATIADSGMMGNLMLLLAVFSAGVLFHGAATKVAGARRHRLAQTRRKAHSRGPREREWHDGY